jgi:uncharacterized membrane protein YeaQ/YmgE (transglycosylase-associated protein family)
MGLVDFLIILLIAAICGAVAEAIVGFSPGGLLVSTGVGLVGAYIGIWLAGQFGLPQLIVFRGIDLGWTILGAMLFLFIVGLIRGRWR